MSDFISNFKKVYIPKIGEEGTLEILEKAQDIVGECIDDNLITKNNVGVIVGKVQSGKTSNFLGVISVAFERGFDTVIILGGWDKTLLKQNFIRAKEVFGNFKRKGEIKQLSKVFKTEIFDKPENITEGSDANFFDPEENKKAIVTILKQIKHLEKTINSIIKNKDIFDKRKVLIIDDEGDQASLDGNFTKREKGKEQTKINKQVTELTKNLKNFAYLTVTATPYANLLLEKQELLSPKFIKLTKPGKGYCGLEEFHLSETNKYIEIINDINGELFEDERYEMESPDSLKRSISYFLCCIIDHLKKGTPLKKYEMLIHIERVTKKQSTIRSQLNKMLSEYREYSQDEQDIDFLMFKDFINEGFRMLFNRELDFSNQEDKEFIQKFKDILGEVHIRLINGTKDALKIQEIEDNYIIYIGSDLLQRGVTLENLIVTYITRIANKNNADTVLQRARWFGYRKKILDYIKIFTTEPLKEMYLMIANLEEKLWQELEQFEAGDTDIDTFLGNLLFSLPKEERITRPNVIKTRYICIKKWQTQNIFHDTNNLEWDYESKLRTEGREEIYGKSVNSKYIEYADWEEFSKNENIEQFILNKIDVDYSQLLKGKNYKTKKVKTILIRSDQDEQVRTLHGEKDIFTLSAAGKRSDEKFDEDKYFGDSNLQKYSSNEDKILIVIYKIRFKKNGEKLPNEQLAYNVYFPGIEVEGYARG
ncbi:Z1 domain-containing protein [Spiroplasma endosymbiont of Diplazon laetatorius]|uniref:Z1 domain-containing protein n=1 Tax=Spiroplasma endosymbiont of Diplazon laetatorius TaxID=3066322 RepID=UPI0030CAB95D